MIDLHVHSTFSDGSFTPEELIGEAARIGLCAIALTDHDTTDGVPRFTAAAVLTSVRAIAGVEISADVKSGTMHMLGYMIDPDNQALIERLKWLREGREARNAEILEKLNKLGFELTWEEVTAFAGEDVVGRPHFAQALLARDLVKDKNEAFDKYLGKGKPAYADRRRMTPEHSIRLIREAGGVPVLAHPFTLNLSAGALKRQVAELRDFGLGGIEVFYSEHTPQMTSQYLNLAGELGLVATGGSDFHGAMNPDIKLGSGFGSLQVPDEVVAQLSAHRN
jgi:predicted metal-dependent phosphoesterase TrpH